MRMRLNSILRKMHYVINIRDTPALARDRRNPHKLLCSDKTDFTLHETSVNGQHVYRQVRVLKQLGGPVLSNHFFAQCYRFAGSCVLVPEDRLHSSALSRLELESVWVPVKALYPGSACAHMWRDNMSPDCLVVEDRLDPFEYGIHLTTPFENNPNRYAPSSTTFTSGDTYSTRAPLVTTADILSSATTALPFLAPAYQVNTTSPSGSTEDDGAGPPPACRSVKRAAATIADNGFTLSNALISSIECLKSSQPNDRVNGRPVTERSQTLAAL